MSVSDFVTQNIKEMCTGQSSFNKINTFPTPSLRTFLHETGSSPHEHMATRNMMPSVQFDARAPPLLRTSGLTPHCPCSFRVNVGRKVLLSVRDLDRAGP